MALENKSDLELIRDYKNGDIKGYNEIAANEKERFHR